MDKQPSSAEQQIQAFLKGKLSKEQERKLKKRIVYDTRYRRIALMELSLYQLAKNYQPHKPKKLWQTQKFPDWASHGEEP